jgi:lysophospholipase L1-like esterase
MQGPGAARWAPVLTALGCAALTVACTLGTVARDFADGPSATVYSLPAEPSPPAPLVLPAHPRVLLLGDSYVNGYGAEPGSEGFAEQVAGRLGWQLTRDGVGTTGYVNSGRQHQGTYAERLARHPANAYDLVVLEGGGNDEKRSVSEISEGVDAAVQVVRKRYPDAQLLLLGPVSPDGEPSSNRIAVNLALVDYAQASSISYINTLAEHWFLAGDLTMVNPVNDHPNTAGYAHIADRLVHDVQSLAAGPGRE